jgi:hypothetical protein
MQRPKSQTQEQPRPRIIDIIAEGLSLVLVRPWLLAVPVLLDLFYWVGVKIEPSALINSLIRLVNDSDVENSAEVVKSLEDMTSSDISQMIGFFSPTMLNQAPREDIYRLVDRTVWSPSSAGVVLLIVLGLFLVSALVAMIYGVPMGDAILGRRRAPMQLVRAIASAWGRFLMLIGLVIGSLIGIAIPLLIVAALAGIGGIDLIPLYTMFFLIAFVMAAFVTPFVLDSIALIDAGPIDAIRFGSGIFRANKLQSTGIVLALMLVFFGLPPIARPLLANLPGVIISIALYALIVTGFIAASMLFFVDRLRKWRPELIQVPQTAPAFDLSRQGENHS